MDGEPTFSAWLKSRRRQLDLWETAEKLLAELWELGWGEPEQELREMDGY